MIGFAVGPLTLVVVIAVVLIAAAFLFMCAVIWVSGEASRSEDWDDHFRDNRRR